MSGFFYYKLAQMVTVSQIVDGHFEVQIEDPGVSRADITSKVFRAGQDPTDWITDQLAKRLSKWLPDFFAHQGAEARPQEVPPMPAPYEPPWADDYYDPFDPYADDRHFPGVY
jgi:hypothetical protein